MEGLVDEKRSIWMDGWITVRKTKSDIHYFTMMYTMDRELLCKVFLQSLSKGLIIKNKLC